ncbi:MAG: glycosyltransferase family 9 protein [Candidatus Omnitrophota bacterium]
MKIDKTKIKRILLITLTNIGDIVLTTPVVSALNREFPDAELDVMVGPGGKDIFKKHAMVSRVVIYDKLIPMREKMRLIRRLRRERYDLVVDLKNTLFPILIGSRYRTSFVQPAQRRCVHKRDFHLSKLKFLGIDGKDAPFSIQVSAEERDYIDGLLQDVPKGEGFVVMSPSAKSLIKRWKKEGFATLADRLARELGFSIIMIGDKSDAGLISDIIGRMESKPLNFAGLTNIPQLAYLLQNARLIITNDSAPMHVGCAAGADVLAIFGPTDPRKYGPLGSNDRIIRRELECSPCEAAQCKRRHECMDMITVDEVAAAAKDMLLRGKTHD